MSTGLFLNVCDCSLAVTSTGPDGFKVYVQVHPKAQPEVVLVFMHQRRLAYSLKSHTTGWESRKSNSGPLGTRRVTYPQHHGSFREAIISIATAIMACERCYIVSVNTYVLY